MSESWANISMVLLVIALVGLGIYTSSLQSRLASYDNNHVDREEFQDLKKEKAGLEDKISNLKSVNTKVMSSSPNVHDPMIIEYDPNGDETISVKLFNYRGYAQGERGSITMEPSCKFTIETAMGEKKVRIEFNETKVKDISTKVLTKERDILTSRSPWYYKSASCEPGINS